MAHWVTLRNGKKVDLDDPNNPITGKGTFESYFKGNINAQIRDAASKQHRSRTLELKTANTRVILKSEVSKYPHQPASKEFMNEQLKPFIEAGGVVWQGPEADRNLKNLHASAAYFAKTIVLGPNPTKSEILEELFHWKQDVVDKFSSNKFLQDTYKEIEAKKWLIKNAKKYNIPDDETKETIEQLTAYRKVLKRGLLENESH